MPELAEVEHHRRRWNAGLGRKVLDVLVHANTRVFRGSDARRLSGELRGRTLLDSAAHGKQMLFRFSGGQWIGVHLGMTGELRLETAGTGFQAGPHDHLVLIQKRQALVFSDPRQFGRIRWDSGPRPPLWWTSLPPAITDREFTSEQVARFLRRRAGSPVKAVLLMQEGFPGIGNWMADEILWRARIHPGTKAGRLIPIAQRLWREVRRVTAGALRIVVPDYSDPPATWLFPHRWRDGGRCPRDGAPLRRAHLGGRTTAWCERCQPRNPFNNSLAEPGPSGRMTP